MPSQSTQLINWETETASSLVRLSAHSIFLKAAGPPRPNPQTPVVLVEAGLGHSSVHWAAVTRLISSFARVYSYDRAGYGKSEPSPVVPRTAENLALELAETLRVAGVKPPYVVVAHSYGGVIAREFMALMNGQGTDTDGIVGLVLVDANSEFSYKVRPEGLGDVLEGLVAAVDFNEVINLAGRHRLMPEEWATINESKSEEEEQRLGETAGLEMDSYELSCDMLGKKNQYNEASLGQGPVSVVQGHNARDIQMLLDYVQDRGLGSAEDTYVLREWLSEPEKDEGLQEDQLRLSGRGRLVKAAKSGHDVQLTEPEVIVDEVRWVLGILEGDRKVAEGKGIAGVGGIEGGVKALNI
jgi:pimeloyl-ACP methyl ester carboxylesterase